MKLLKRRTLDEYAEEQLGPAVQRAMRSRPLRKLFYNRKAVSPRRTAEIIDLIRKTNSYTGMTLLEKVYLYALCSVVWRMGEESFLTDPDYNRLLRHLWSSKIAAELGTSDNVIRLGHMVWWDLPDLSKRYPKPGSLVIPAPKPKRIKRGKRHRIRSKPNKS